MAGKAVADIIADFQRGAIAYHAAYEEALKRDPALSEIRQRIGALGFRKMQDTLNGKPTQPVDTLLQRLEKDQAARTKALGLQPYRCSKCSDRGFLEQEVCSCLRRDIYRDHYGALDVGETAGGLTGYPLERLDDEIKQPFYDLTHREMVHFGVRAFTDLLNKFPNGGRGLLIRGSAGVGKTYLAVHAAVEARQRGMDVLYLRATEMHDLYYRHRLGKEVEPYYLETSGLLIVDDLGAEPVTKNVTREALYRVIEERHLRLLPTVFVTNLCEFQDTYGERIASRLFDTARFQFIPVNGDDLRLLPGK